MYDVKTTALSCILPCLILSGGIFLLFQNRNTKKYMPFSARLAIKSSIVNTVNDEQFVNIYTSDESAVQLLDNGRTIMNVKFIRACALGIHSYSSGIYRIRIKVDRGCPCLGIRSRNIPPTPNAAAAGRYDTSPSTYGWGCDYQRMLNGQYDRYRADRLERDGHVYVITLNCDEHKLSIVNENTKEQDQMEVDARYAPFPWCLFVDLPRVNTRVSLV